MIYILLDFITTTEASIRELNSQDKHERKKKKKQTRNGNQEVTGNASIN